MITISYYSSFTLEKDIKYIRECCCHLNSNCSNLMQWYMRILAYLVSPCTQFNTSGCVDVCHSFIWSGAISQWISSDTTFLSRVITGENRCFNGYNPETKEQFFQWKNSSRKGEAGEELLIIFFKTNGIVHKEFIPPGNQ